MTDDNWQAVPTDDVFWPMTPRTYSIAMCAWWLLHGEDDDALNLACCYDDTVAAGLVWC